MVQWYLNIPGGFHYSKILAIQPLLIRIVLPNFYVEVNTICIWPYIQFQRVSHTLDMYLIVSRLKVVPNQCTNFTLRKKWNKTNREGYKNYIKTRALFCACGFIKKDLDSWDVSMKRCGVPVTIDTSLLWGDDIYDEMYTNTILKVDIGGWWFIWFMWRYPILTLSNRWEIYWFQNLHKRG